VVTATDSLDAAAHYIIALDSKKVEGFNGNPICCLSNATQATHGMKFVSDDKFLVDSGKGTIAIYSASLGRSNEMEIRQLVVDTKIHSGDHIVRESAVNPLNRNQFGSGGSEKKFQLIEVGNSAFRSVSSLVVDDVIGSVRWSSFLSGCCSFTQDDGKLIVLDPRQQTLKALTINTGKNDLFAHEVYTPHHILLGYGDGVLQNVDIRLARDHVVCSTVEPYVGCIGNILWNDVSQSFAVSGTSDFGVWLRKSDNVARIWSHAHSSANPSTSVSLYTINAIYLSDSVVLTTDSHGMCSIITQSFQ